MSQEQRETAEKGERESQQGIPDQQAALAQLREQIDDVDRQLVGALGRRMRLAKEVAAIKGEQNIPMMQPGRVSQVQDNIAGLARDRGLPAEYVQQVYQLIIEETCRMEDELIGSGTAASPSARPRVIGIDHVAVAVNDLEQAIASLRDHYGFEVIERRDVEGTVSGMTSATMRAGDASIVLCQGTSAQSNVSRYVENVGQGVQHVALRIEGHQQLVAELASMGADLLTGIIHAPGLDQTFTRRDGATGLQFEFVSRNEHTGFEDSNVRELFEAMEREDVW
jgi:chorismate mutase-like protein